MCTESGGAASGGEGNPCRRYFVCPACGAPPRPAVLMFGDDDWVGNAAAEARYVAWEAAMEEQMEADETARLVVLEIGCGIRVPCVRDEAEMVVIDTAKRMRAHQMQLDANRSSQPPFPIDTAHKVSTVASGAAMAEAKEGGTSSPLVAPAHCPPRALLIRINPDYPGFCEEIEEIKVDLGKESDSEGLCAEERCEEGDTAAAGRLRGRFISIRGGALTSLTSLREQQHLHCQ